MRAFVLACAIVWAALGCARLSAASPSWNAQAAAEYLDTREAWWMAWPAAARDHQTFCVSCHTAVPYALSRPLLRATLGEPRPADAERKLRDSVAWRVTHWAETEPYYRDQDQQSRGTEAVLNALILACGDEVAGKLSAETREALRILWALQQTSGGQRGAWPWINFSNEPWEAADSPYYGAALAAIAVGTAPENYQADPAIRGVVALLRDYLAGKYPQQSAMNQAFLLWASGKLRGLLTPDQQDGVRQELLRAQRSDGGWSTAALGWSWRATSVSSLFKMWIRSDETPQAGSDGLATGLVVYALLQTGTSQRDARLSRGLDWLARNQDRKNGRWMARSLNARRDPSSAPANFMTDAATGFAVLALSSSKPD